MKLNIPSLAFLGLLAGSTLSQGALFITTYAFNEASTVGTTTGAGAGNVTASNAVLGAGLPNSGFSTGTDSVFIRSNEAANTEALSVTGNDYAQFTLTAATGFVLNLSSLSYELAAEGDGAISVTNFVRSNAELTPYSTTIAGSTLSDSITSARGFNTAVNDGGLPYVSSGSVSLAAAQYQGLSSITFRLYQFDDQNDSNRRGRQDDFTVNGDVVMIPEPSSALLLGIAGLALVARRRR